MGRKIQIIALLAVAALAVNAAAPVSPQAASNELSIARRALGDGNWYTAEHRAEVAAGFTNLQVEARLVQMEVLARSGRISEIPSRLESWGNPSEDPFRYWHAYAMVEAGNHGKARELLKRKFSSAEFAVLSERLSGRLERASGNLESSAAHFESASAMIPSNAVARVENAVEWAQVRVAAGDAKGAMEVLTKEGAVKAEGAAGDSARLLAADIAAASGDAKGARALRESIVAAGNKSTEETFVRSALALAEEDWLAGSTNTALAFASNAVDRASQKELKFLAGFDLGFRELAVPSLRTNGIARIGALVRADPDAPGASEALVRLADALLVGGDAADALKAYDQFLQAYPTQSGKVHILEGRGLAFAALGRSTEAVGAFSRASQMATNVEDRARCQFHQGDALLAAKRFTEAADVYGAIRGTNLFAFAQFQRADALSRAGKPEEAARQFQKVMDSGSDFAIEAGLRLASGAASAGRTEMAIDVYNRLLGEKVKSDADILDEAGGRSAKKQNKKQNTTARPLPALSQEQRTRAIEGRGRANYRAYRFEDAERDFTEVAKVDAARAGQMRFFCSLCRYGAGRDEDAYDSAKALMNDTPDSPLRADLMLWLAKFDFARRDYASAFTAFESCATNRHLSTVRRLDALVRAARCAAAQSDYPKLIEVVSRVLSNPAAVAATKQKTEETPIVADALLLQGEALIDQARFGEAVLVLERASRLPVTDEVRRRAMILRADSLFARGADDTAYYQQAVDAYRMIQQDADVPPSTRLAVSFKLARALEKLHNNNEANDQYYANVVMAYVDGVKKKGVLFDGNARAFFARAAFNLADAYESSGNGRQAERILRYVVDAQVPAADEARKRISRLKREGASK